MEPGPVLDRRARSMVNAASHQPQRPATNLVLVILEARVPVREVHLTLDPAPPLRVLECVTEVPLGHVASSVKRRHPHREGAGHGTGPSRSAVPAAGLESCGLPVVTPLAQAPAMLGVVGIKALQDQGFPVYWIVVSHRGDRAAQDTQRVAAQDQPPEATVALRVVAASPRSGVAVRVAPTARRDLGASRYGASSPGLHAAVPAPVSCSCLRSPGRTTLWAG